MTTLLTPIIKDHKNKILSDMVLKVKIAGALLYCRDGSSIFFGRNDDSSQYIVVFVKSKDIILCMKQFLAPYTYL